MPLPFPLRRAKWANTTRSSSLSKDTSSGSLFARASSLRRASRIDENVTGKVVPGSRRKDRIPPPSGRRPTRQGSRAFPQYSGKDLREPLQVARRIAAPRGRGSLDLARPRGRAEDEQSCVPPRQNSHDVSPHYRTAVELGEPSDHFKTACARFCCCNGGQLSQLPWSVIHAPRAVRTRLLRR